MEQNFVGQQGFWTLPVYCSTSCIDLWYVSARELWNVHEDGLEYSDAINQYSQQTHFLWMIIVLF